MNDEPESTQEQISRRRALKRMAAAGAIAWATPVVQSVNMRRAWATNGSPERVCYRIKIESNGSCQTGLGRNDCLDPSSPDGLLTTGGCQAAAPIMLTKDPVHPNCIWTITVNSDCVITEATAKTGNECQLPGDPDLQVTGLGTNTVTINTCSFKLGISHVELAVCCEQQTPTS
jgi:hypothetical protein